MSRERPSEPPRSFADPRGKYETTRQRRAREDLERLKNTQGPGFFGTVAAVLGPSLPNVRFTRLSYESGIIDDLNAFYAARPRPWRPASRAPKVNRKTLPRSIGRREMHRRQASNRLLDSGAVYDQPSYRLP